MSSKKRRKYGFLKNFQIFSMQLLEDFDIVVELRFYIVALESKETAGKGRKLRFWPKNKH